MNNEQCTIFVQTERSSQIYLDDAEVQPKITQKRSGCIMNNVQFTMNNEQWKKVKLGEVGKISMCKRVFSFETSTEGEIPFYKIGTFGKDADAFISRQLYEEYKSKFSYPKVGDILISASGTIGRTVVYDGEPAYFQDSNIIWIDNDETIVLNQFLYYQYQIISWNLEGSTIARLYNDNFNKIEITIPDLPAQRRIAAILTSADKVIAATQKTIAKYKQIKQGMMEDLLKPKEGWKMVKLGEVYNFQYGDGNKNPNNNGDYPIYGANGIIGGYTKFNAVDSVVIGHMGEYAGSVIWANGKHFVTYNGTITIVKDNNSLYDRFGYFVLLNLDIKKICAGSGQPFLSYDTLNKIEISIPDLAAQRRIAAILSGIDAKIAAEEKVLQKYEKVKKGLMERMLNDNK